MKNKNGNQAEMPSASKMFLIVCLSIICVVVLMIKKNVLYSTNNDKFEVDNAQEAKSKQANANVINSVRITEAAKTHQEEKKIRKHIKEVKKDIQAASTETVNNNSAEDHLETAKQSKEMRWANAYQEQAVVDDDEPLVDDPNLWLSSADVKEFSEQSGSR
ncbi:MAG: hypothetical protein HQK53_03115 [Oligoflexia bacterium]|nr:hypothetical protein [Oligoflexia bacterium]